MHCLAVLGWDVTGIIPVVASPFNSLTFQYPRFISHWVDTHADHHSFTAGLRTLDCISSFYDIINISSTSILPPWGLYYTPCPCQTTVLSYSIPRFPPRCFTGTSNFRPRFVPPKVCPFSFSLSSGFCACARTIILYHYRAKGIPKQTTRLWGFFGLASGLSLFQF